MLTGPTRARVGLSQLGRELTANSPPELAGQLGQELIPPEVTLSETLLFSGGGAGPLAPPNSQTSWGQLTRELESQLTGELG